MRQAGKPDLRTCVRLESLTYEHEPHAGRHPAVVAVRPVAAARAGADRGRLPARLARPEAARPAALARRPPRRLPRRPALPVRGPGLAGRAVRGAVAPGPHAPALVADDGRPAAALAGRAAAAAAARPAAPAPHPLGRPAAALAPAAGPVHRADTAGPGVAALRRRHLALARPGNLRGRAALPRLALPPACLLL